MKNEIKAGKDKLTRKVASAKKTRRKIKANEGIVEKGVVEVGVTEEETREEIVTIKTAASSLMQAFLCLLKARDI